MTTKAVLDGGTKGQASEALDRLAPDLYENDGKKVMAIVEFAVSECVKPGPETDKDRKVRLKVNSCEVAIGEQEHVLRSAQKGLWLQRTATGTLTEDGDVQYSKALLEHLDGQTDATEAVRLRVALDWMHSQIAAISRKAGTDGAGMRKELKALVKISASALAGQQLTLDDATKAAAAFASAAAEVDAEEAAQLEHAQDRLDETAPVEAADDSGAPPAAFSDTKPKSPRRKPEPTPDPLAEDSDDD